MRRFVIVSGLPGSGKTTLGRALANSLGLTLLDKDDLLEALFDSLGTGDGAWRQRLSRASDEILRKLANESPGAVLASFWRHPQMDRDSGTPTSWISALPGRVVEVHCSCPPEIAAKRFQGRVRHPGHLDQYKDRTGILDNFRSLARHGALGVGPLVKVDTSGSVNIESVVREIMTKLWDQEPA